MAEEFQALRRRSFYVKTRLDEIKQEMKTLKEEWANLKNKLQSAPKRGEKGKSA